MVYIQSEKDVVQRRGRLLHYSRGRKLLRLLECWKEERILGELGRLRGLLVPLIGRGRMLLLIGVLRPRRRRLWGLGCGEPLFSSCFGGGVGRTVLDLLDVDDVC